MRIAIIGRSKVLYDCAKLLKANGFEIPLIVTSKEAPEYSIKNTDFEKLADEFGAKFIYTPRINEQEILNQIDELEQIHIAVSINYTGVIGQTVIDKFEFGILNAHGGDLPRYRGNACQAWAIINKEDKIGLCVHKMIGGELDSGNILSRSFLPININTRVGEVYDWMEKETPKLMLNAIDLLKEDPNYILEEQSKDPEDALRCYPRKPEDGKIDWNDTSENILRLINASSEPFIGAFTYLNEQKLTIWRASLDVEKENFLAVPGQVCKINKVEGYVDVATANGKLRLLEAELNEVRSEACEFFNSIRLRLK